jgi:hypothetical protein
MSLQGLPTVDDFVNPLEGKYPIVPLGERRQVGDGVTGMSAINFIIRIISMRLADSCTDPAQGKSAAANR